MITKHTINAYKDGQIKSAHLMTSRYPHRPGTVIHQLAMVKDGQVLYTDKLTQGSSADKIKVEADSQTWYVSDITPTVTITSSITSNPAPYSYPRVVNWIQMTLNVAINNPIELQYYVNYAWVTLLTLPAGSVSAYDSGGYRLPDDKWRVKVGSWTSMFQQYTGSDSTTRNIPEAYWGV